MDIKLDINPEDIQKYIVDTIMQSTIGTEVKKVVEEKVNSVVNYNYSFKQALESIVTREIETITRELIREKYFNSIRAAIETKITEEFTGDLLNKLFDSWYNKYN